MKNTPKAAWIGVIKLNRQVSEVRDPEVIRNGTGNGSEVLENGRVGDGFAVLKIGGDGVYAE